MNNGRTLFLLGTLAVVVAAFAYSRTKQGAQVVSDIATSVGNLLTNRGLRDNNPGNLRRGGSNWEGQLSQTDVVGAGGTWDTEFAQFSTIGYGVRAIGRTLLTYQSRYGLDTVNQIANRYAPPSENDTVTYAQRLADYVGVGVDDPIDFGSMLPQLVAGIMINETGYTDDLANIQLEVYS